MANNLDVKSRDIRDELDADDPLLELTRIMGLASRRDEMSTYNDPQISIEDDFSLDLEQDIQLDQNSEVELNASDFSLDDDFSQSFESELSQTLQFGAETPSVVPSLEDELEALLAGAPAQAPVQPAPFEVSPSFEATQAIEVEPSLEFDPAELSQPTFEAEPWLEPDFEPFMDGAEVTSDPEYVPEIAVEDPIFAQMNRVFGRSNLSVNNANEIAEQPYEQANIAVATDGDLDEAFHASEIDFEALDQSVKGSNAVVDFQFDDEEIDSAEKFEPSDSVVSEWEEPVSTQAVSIESDDPLKRLVGKTGLEPVVEATEFEADGVTAMDELDIPDFDFEPQNLASSSTTLDLDDDYQGYEPPVARVPEPLVEPVIDDFAIDMSSVEDNSELDFEDLLNDELTASVDDSDHRYGYQAEATVAGVAGAAAYRAQKSDYRDEMPDVGFLADDSDAPVLSRREGLPKSTWLIAAAIGAIALLGAGYYALSGPSSGTAGDAPVLVKADPNPVKVAPETPGGKTVANQDQAVYDKVGGEGTALPSQGQLVSESEEPVDIASVAVNDAVDPNVKSEERVDPALETIEASGQAADTIAVSPKKVRTVIVKPDGTLVERPAEPAAAIPAEAVTAPAVPEVTTAAPEAPVAATPVVEAQEPKTEVAAVTPEPTPAPEAPAAEVVAKVADAVVETPKPAPAIKVVKTKKIKAPAAETTKATIEENTGAAPVLESRPADQPVNIVGKTGKTPAQPETQVAAADPVAEVPASGSYSMQIASTPSPEAAKSTYVALTRKFGSVLIGRGVNVQKAEVAGKGTVYRVRIPAGSKQEAAALCQQYKSAGGNCFITK
jgi:SPOR domain